MPSGFWYFFPTGMHEQSYRPSAPDVDLQFGSYTSAETNDAQLEDLCKRGEVALQNANMKPLDPIVLHDASWKGVFEALTALIGAEKIDPPAIDDELELFVLKIGKRSFQCRVPVTDSDGALIYCEHQVMRKDRILRHVKDVHLLYRPFVCGGKCGDVVW